MIRLTLEERVARLERLLTRKDEFLGFGKLKAKEENDFVDKMFKKYPSMRDVFGSYKASKKDDATFHIVLQAPDKRPYNGMTFIISTKGGRKEAYVNASDKYNNVLGGYRNLNIDTDMNKIAGFIMQTLQNAGSSNESRRRRRFKSVAMTTFDCETVAQMIEDSMDDLPEIEVSVNDDNADYGFVNVEFGNPGYVTDYNIIADDIDKFKVENENKSVGTAKSLEDATDIVCDHFMDNYINGKFKK